MYSINISRFRIKDSIKEVTNYQFNNIFKYDKTLIINENKDYNLIKNYITNDNDINKFTEVNTQTITVEYNNKEQDVTLVTPNNFKELKNIIYLSNIDDGKEIEEPPYNTCIISEKTSKLLNIKSGDTLAIINNENNNKDKSILYYKKLY